MHDRHDQQKPDRRRPPDPFDQQQDKTGAGQRDQNVLDRKVVEVTGVLHDRVEQCAFLALVSDEGVAGDDLGLLQHPDELWEQHRQRRHGDTQQGHEVARPAQHRVAQCVQQPPRDHKGDHHDAAGDVHGEYPDQRQHRQRNAFPVSQRRGDQHERRNRDTEGGHIGHRGGVELHVGNRGERRRQRGGGGGRARGAPPGGAGNQQPPGEQPGAEWEQPHRGSQRGQGVGGCRSGAGELSQHGTHRMKGGRVVESSLGLDIAQLTHMRGGGLPGIEDPPDGVGVPDGIPGAGDRLPVRHAPPRGDPDCERADDHPRGRSKFGPVRTAPAAATRPPMMRAAAFGDQKPVSQHHICQRHEGHRRAPGVPRDAQGSEWDDHQAHNTVGQRWSDRDGQRPAQPTGKAHHGARQSQ